MWQTTLKLKKKKITENLILYICLRHQQTQYSIITSTNSNDVRSAFEYKLICSVILPKINTFGFYSVPVLRSSMNVLHLSLVPGPAGRSYMHCQEIEDRQSFQGHRQIQTGIDNSICGSGKVLCFGSSAEVINKWPGWTSQQRSFHSVYLLR